MDTTIANRYRLEEPLDISKDICEYRAIDIPTSHSVLVKILKDARKSEKFFLESKILSLLEENCKQGFPKLFYEMSSDSLSVIVLSYFSAEHSLSKVFQHEKRVMPLESIVCLTIVLIKRLQDIHTLGIIHNNINPRSFFISKTNDIYLTDFSVATFIDKSKFLTKSPESDSPHQHRKFFGTMKFCSLNSHYGRPLTYKDDLESLIYSIIYLACGKLPWTEATPPNNLPNENSMAKNHFYLKLKRDTPVEEICQDLPKEFREFLADVRMIPKRSVELPNYQKYAEMFLRLLNELIIPQKNQPPIVIPSNRFIKKLPQSNSPAPKAKTDLPSLKDKPEVQQAFSSPSSSREFDLSVLNAISQSVSASNSTHSDDAGDPFVMNNDQNPPNPKKINSLQYYYNPSSFISYNIAKLSISHTNSIIDVKGNQSSVIFNSPKLESNVGSARPKSLQPLKNGPGSFSLLQNYQVLYPERPVVEGNSKMASRIDLGVNKKHNLLYKIKSKSPPK